MLLKRLGGETAAGSFTAGRQSDSSVILSRVSSFEASDASDLQAGEKAGPFGLPCITDEKLLMLMAQDSVNGRLAALHASDSPVGTSVDDEPAAVPIAVGGSVTGVVDVIGDMDDINVTLVAGQRYMISLMGTGASALGDSYLEIFDPSMVGVGHDDDGGVGRNSVITITAAVSGTYTIRASAFASPAGQGVGQYTVDVRQMGTDSIPATIAGAVPIDQGITFGFRETDASSGGADSDYYKVSLVAGTSYSFSVSAGTDHESTFNPIAAGEIDTILVLRGPTGAILVQNDDISYPTDASSTFQFHATTTGDYYLEVTAYPALAGPGGNTGGYVIDFHEVPPPDPLDSLDWGTAANIPTVMVDGVPTAYIYFAAAGENFGENARSGDPSQAASGGNGTLVSYGWTEYEKAQFMLAMQEYTKILGIVYVETTNSAEATFRVITNSSYTYGAYAYPQDPAYGTQRGIMVFNVDNRGWDLDSADPAVTTDGLGRGGFSWATILHEAGHAHGLAHPHDTGGGSAVMMGVASPYSLGAFNLNQQIYTQMSYNDGWQTHPDGSVTNGDPDGWRSDAGWLATMGAFDIAVLQARYGVAPVFATGDNVYTLLDVNAEGTYFETIYDTGGTDTIAYDGARGAQIDLNTATLDYSVTGGGIVSFVRNLPGQTTAQAIKGGFTIANGVVIENATGGGGDDVLIGNDADNVLTGNGGNDVLMGNGGADILIGGAGTDSYAGGDGADTIDFSGEAGPVAVNLHSTESFLAFHSPTTLLSPGEALDSFGNREAMSGIEIFILSAGSDSALGSEGADRIEAGAGNDILIGRGGNDVFLGGAGGDGLYGQVGDDWLEGGDGDDFLEGHDGNDRLEGGGGRDHLYADGDDDLLSGGGGNDVLMGGSGVDSFDGGADWDVLSFYEVQATQGVVADLRTGIISNDGYGNAETMSGVEALERGTAFVDIFYGNDNSNALMIERGDFAYGFGGDDQIWVGLAPAHVDGGAGTDNLVAIVDGNFFLPDTNGDGRAERSADMTAGWKIDLFAGTIQDGFGNSGTVTGIESVSGTRLADDLRGDSGGNVLYGDAGNDVLRLQDGGDDTALGAAGNDSIFFIGALTGADMVDGGEGTDTLILQGAYGSLALTANVTRIENISILGGNNTNFGEPGTNRHDYVLTTHNLNFAAGVQARINGSALLAGEDFTFDGSAEADASFVVYGGKGTDTLTGGQGNDIFFYAEERFASGDTVNGGAGYDGIFLRGNYTIDFTAPGYAGLFTNIENLTLTSATDERYARGGGTEFDYNLTLSDAIVNAGQTLTVSGALLMATETMVLDASAETDGMLRLFGGKASDTLKGGAQADLIHGNLGADTLAGNGGSDAFRYQNVAESNSGSTDHILDFTPGTDKIELDRIDADALAAGNQAFTWIGSNAFSNQVGQLRAYEQSGTWFVEGDVNGDGAADLVIALTLQGPEPLGAGDFLL